MEVVSVGESHEIKKQNIRIAKINMNIAMLWYDPDPKTEGANTSVAGITVVKDVHIDLNYLWIGVKRK